MELDFGRAANIDCTRRTSALNIRPITETGSNFYSNSVKTKARALPILLHPAPYSMESTIGEKLSIEGNSDAPYTLLDQNPVSKGLTTSDLRQDPGFDASEPTMSSYSTCGHNAPAALLTEGELCRLYNVLDSKTYARIVSSPLGHSDECSPGMITDVSGVKSRSGAESSANSPVRVPLSASSIGLSHPNLAPRPRPRSISVIDNLGGPALHPKPLSPLLFSPLMDPLTNSRLCLAKEESARAKAPKPTKTTKGDDTTTLQDHEYLVASYERELDRFLTDNSILKNEIEIKDKGMEELQVENSKLKEAVVKKDTNLMNMETHLQVETSRLNTSAEATIMRLQEKTNSLREEKEILRNVVERDTAKFKAEIFHWQIGNSKLKEISELYKTEYIQEKETSESRTQQYTQTCLSMEAMTIEKYICKAEVYRCHMLKHVYHVGIVTSLILNMAGCFYFICFASADGSIRDLRWWRGVEWLFEIIIPLLAMLVQAESQFSHCPDWVKDALRPDDSDVASTLSRHRRKTEPLGEKSASNDCEPDGNVNVGQKGAEFRGQREVRTQAK